MDYYLGLDMGTSSVGWAVTDKEYNLIRAKGKDLWGIREFEEAHTAVDRRLNRIARRRRQRQIVRIGMLKSYFHDEIYKADPYFYQRLENSKYWAEDKDKELTSVNAFFDDPDYKDRDYFKEYPTIFHLRKELIENNEKHDIRLVFLALLNMFKHRGHFLYENIESSGESFGESYNALISELKDISEIEHRNLTQDEIKELEKILGSRDYSRTVKSEKTAEFLRVDRKKDKKAYEIIRTLCGLKTDAKKIFSIEEVDEKINIDFSSSQYEESKGELSSVLGDDNFGIIELLKKLHDLSLLSSILHGFDYLSNARVGSYEQHRSDLVRLKK